MLLSDAILKGCEHHKKGRGRLVSYDILGRTKTCVLGAAYVGLFGEIPQKHSTRHEEQSDAYSILRTWFPELNDPVLFSRIIMANDWTDQTREEIATLLKEEGL